MALKYVLLVHPDLEASLRISAPLQRIGGFSVRKVHSGFDAAVEILSGKYDCLLLHTDTPGLHPVRTIQHIRSLANGSKLTILVIGKSIDERKRLVFKRAGANGIAPEPLKLQVLIPVMRRLLGSEEPQAKPPATAQARPSSQEKLASAQAGRASSQSGQASSQAGQASSSAKKSASETPGQTTSEAADSNPSEVRTVRKALVPRRPARPPLGSAALAEVITDAARRCGRLPGMPPWFSRLDFLIGDVLGDFVSKDVVALDLSLSLAVLRMVNSIYYQAVEPIAGLAQALTRLGHREVAKLYVESRSVRQEVRETVQGFLVNSFWKRNLTVACLAEEIARFGRITATDGIFSAGLLHNVGKLFLIHHYEKEFLEAQDRISRSEPRDGQYTQTCEIEREVFGIDHGRVGFELCQGCRLPSIVAAGTLHHAVHEDAVAALPEARVARIVALAVLLAPLMEGEDAAAGPGGATDTRTGHEPADRPTGGKEVPVLRMTATRTVIRTAPISADMVNNFLYEHAPAWVHELMQRMRLPIGRVTERAQMRVYEAVHKIGLTD
ncbi:HDOD domain-containing protein [Candidatus Eisenbacteria bacterium]|uniref:HDOD domain-containing protein n=1 Tax=Eiseniibacteriota bacterium TaxID=2212470 RepID=A0ABV6YM37_UNCEI